MGTNPSVRLVREAQYIDLMAGRYVVTADFVPPALIESVIYGTGSAQNKSGASRIDSIPENRSFSFRLNIKTGSALELNRALSDISGMLAYAGDRDKPVYLEYRPHSDAPRPTWGQDGTLRYEIVAGRIVPGDEYSETGVPRGVLLRCMIQLNLKPYAIGLPQIACQAMGGVVHDTAGTVDGQDRGVSVPSATVNHFPNPIFGNSIWNTGWGAGSNLLAYENSDMAFVLYGVRSAKLQATTGATRTYFSTMTLTAETYTLSFYAKRPDGDLIDINTCQAFFVGSPQTSTYTSVGDGWYRVVYTATASASSSTYGVRVASGVTVYVDGFQIENLGFPTLLHHGDMYGYAWTGTAHSSTTSATVGYLRLPLDPTIFSAGQGTIRTVIHTPSASSAHDSNMCVWYEAFTGLKVFFDRGVAAWVISDATNTHIGGTQVGGSTYAFHAVWEPGRLQLFINGSSAASGGTYTPATVTPAYLYIGTSPTPALAQNQVYRDFAIYGEAMTSAQVANDYANIAPIVNDNQRVNSIPYLWTRSGDGEINSYEDAANGGFGVIQGVPGRALADAEYELSGGLGGVPHDAVTMALWRTPEYIHPTRVIYAEQSGTPDTLSSGSAYRRTALSSFETTVTAASFGWRTDPKLTRFVRGREWYARARVRAASSGVKIRHGFPTLARYSDTNYVGTYWYHILYPSLVFPDLVLDETGALAPDVPHHLYATGASGVNVDVDYYVLLPRPIISFHSNLAQSRLRGNAVKNIVLGHSYLTSDILDPAPNAYNVLFYSYEGYSEFESNAINVFTNVAPLKLWPRYPLV